MANILSRIWDVIAGCFRRQLDDEIERVIVAHDQHRSLSPSVSTPIIIHNWNESPRTKRRHGVSDLTKIDGYQEFKSSLRPN